MDALNQQPKKKKGWILTLLFVLLNVGVLLWIGFSELKRKEESSTGFADISVHWPFLVLSFLCFLTMVLSESGKFYFLILRLTEKKDFSTAVKATLYGYYYDNITPSGAGGQPFQIHYLRKCGLPNGASLAIPVYSFLLYQITFVVTAGLTFLLFRNMFDYPGIRVTAIIGISICSLIPLGIIIAAVFPKTMARFVMFVLRGLAAIRIIKNPEEKGDKFLRHLTEYSDAINYINRHRRLSLEMLLLSVLYHVARCSLPFFILRAFGAEVEYLYTLVATYYLYAAIKIIPTPGGAGAAEASFYLIFSELPEPGLIFWAMLVWRFFNDYIFLLCGMALTSYEYLKAKVRARRQKRLEARETARTEREKARLAEEEARRLEKEASEAEKEGRRNKRKRRGKSAAAENEKPGNAAGESDKPESAAAENAPDAGKEGSTPGPDPGDPARP